MLWVVVVLAVFSAADYFLKFYRSLGFAEKPVR
jgi:hypothetical protein